MFLKVLAAIFLLTGALSSPVPDRLPQRYGPPSQPTHQYSAPQAQFAPRPQPRPQPHYQPPQPQYQPPQPQYQPSQPSYRAPQSTEQFAPAKYDFNWAVKDDLSGNDFGQTENREDSNTQGSYYVNLPDGRRQTVNYYVNGDSGFVADVKYEGEARFPEPQQQYRPQPQPTYQPPRTQQGYS